jgi:hypothetical protein
LPQTLPQQPAATAFGLDIDRGRFQHTAVSFETARIEGARRRVFDIRQDFCV